MSFLSNLMTKMNLNRDSDDDYDLDHDYDFDDEYEEEEEEAPRKPSFFGRRVDEEEEAEPKIRFFSKAKSNTNERRASMEVTMIKPNSMGDATEICDYLLSGRAVVLEQPMPLMEICRRFPPISLLSVLKKFIFPVNSPVQVLEEMGKVLLEL